jgi:hypothetical protein
MVQHIVPPFRRASAHDRRRVLHFNVTAELLVPKTLRLRRFFHPAETWLAVNAPRARSPIWNRTEPKSSLSTATAIKRPAQRPNARRGCNTAPKVLAGVRQPRLLYGTQAYVVTGPSKSWRSERHCGKHQGTGTCLPIFPDIARRIVFKKPVAIKLIRDHWREASSWPRAGHLVVFSLARGGCGIRFSFIIRYMRFGVALALIEGEAHGYETHKSPSLGRQAGVDRSIC